MLRRLQIPQRIPYGGYIGQFNAILARKLPEQARVWFTAVAAIFRSVRAIEYVGDISTGVTDPIEHFFMYPIQGINSE